MPIRECRRNHTGDQAPLFKSPHPQSILAIRYDIQADPLWYQSSLSVKQNITHMLACPHIYNGVNNILLFIFLTRDSITAVTFITVNLTITTVSLRVGVNVRGLEDRLLLGYIYNVSSCSHQLQETSYLCCLLTCVVFYGDVEIWEGEGKVVVERINWLQVGLAYVLEWLLLSVAWWDSNICIVL